MRKAQADASSLQAVVEDTEDLLVIGVAGLRVRQFVQVDHLIQTHQQPRVARQSDEPRQQFEMVVDAGIVNDGTDAQARSGHRSC